MRILIALKSEFDQNAIQTWLKRRNRKDEILTATSLAKAELIFKENLLDWVILGEGLHPENQNKWLQEIRVSNVVAEPLFIFPISGNYPFFKIKIHERNLALVHYNDAMHFFVEEISSLPVDCVYLSETLQSSLGNIPDLNHPLKLLSKAELRVADLVVHGWKNEDIANSLFISVNTVSDHRKNIKEKLEVSGGKNSLINYLMPFSLWIGNMNI